MSKFDVCNVQNRRHYFSEILGFGVRPQIFMTLDIVFSLHSLDSIGFKGTKFISLNSQKAKCFECLLFSASFQGYSNQVLSAMAAVRRLVKTQKKNSTSKTYKSSPKHPNKAQGVPNFRFFKTGLDVGGLRRLSDTIRPLQDCL